MPELLYRGLHKGDQESRELLSDVLHFRWKELLGRDRWRNVSKKTFALLTLKFGDGSDYKILAFSGRDGNKRLCQDDLQKLQKHFQNVYVAPLSSTVFGQPLPQHREQLSHGHVDLHSRGPDGKTVADHVIKRIDQEVKNKRRAFLGEKKCSTFQELERCIRDQFWEDGLGERKSKLEPIAYKWALMVWDDTNANLETFKKMLRNTNNKFFHEFPRCLDRINEHCNSTCLKRDFEKARKLVDDEAAKETRSTRWDGKTDIAKLTDIARQLSIFLYEKIVLAVYWERHRPQHDKRMLSGEAIERTVENNERSRNEVKQLFRSYASAVRKPRDNDETCDDRSVATVLDCNIHSSWMLENLRDYMNGECPLQMDFIATLEQCAEQNALAALSQEKLGAAETVECFVGTLKGEEDFPCAICDQLLKARVGNSG